MKIRTLSRIILFLSILLLLAGVGYIELDQITSLQGLIILSISMTSLYIAIFLSEGGIQIVKEIWRDYHRPSRIGARMRKREQIRKVLRK